MSSTKVFVFEVSSCVNADLSPKIVVEGLGMFSTLMRDFSTSAIASPFSFVRPGILRGVGDSYSPQYWNVEEVSVELEGSYNLFEEFCERSDRVLAIAPEDDMMLYKYTRIADKHSNVGSSSKVVRICSDKWEVYRRLKRKIDVPKTCLKPLNLEKQVVKPRVSCGGCGVRLYDINCTDNLDNLDNRQESQENSVIYQEFIDGVNLSVSMIAGEDVAVLSINEQILDGFEYFGAVVPARVDRTAKREVADVAVESASILGLKGYCGIDIVYSDKPYVIDVNARMTTPSIAFFQTYGINLGKLILENYERGRVESVELAGLRRIIESEHSRVLLKKGRGDGGRSARFLVGFKGMWITLFPFPFPSPSPSPSPSRCLQDH